jgi:hypothetical protein
MPVVSNTVQLPGGAFPPVVHVRVEVMAARDYATDPIGTVISGVGEAPYNPATGTWTITLPGNETLQDPGSTYRVVESIPQGILNPTPQVNVYEFIMPATGGPYTVAGLMGTSPAPSYMVWALNTGNRPMFNNPTAGQDGYFLTYDEGTNRIILSANSGAVQGLDALTDVILSGNEDLGSILRHNGTAFVDVLGTDFFAPLIHTHAPSVVTVSPATGALVIDMANGFYKVELGGRVDISVLPGTSNGATYIEIGQLNPGNYHVTWDPTIVFEGNAQPTLSRLPGAPTVVLLTRMGGTVVASSPSAEFPGFDPISVQGNTASTTPPNTSIAEALTLTNADGVIAAATSLVARAGRPAVTGGTVGITLATRTAPAPGPAGVPLRTLDLTGAAAKRLTISPVSGNLIDRALGFYVGIGFKMGPKGGNDKFVMGDPNAVQRGWQFAVNPGSPGLFVQLGGGTFVNFGPTVADKVSDGNYHVLSIYKPSAAVSNNMAVALDGIVLVPDSGSLDMTSVGTSELVNLQIGNVPSFGTWGEPAMLLASWAVIGSDVGANAQIALDRWLGFFAGVSF